MTMDFGQLAVDKLSDSLKLNNTESNSNYHRSFQDIGVGEWDVHISRKHYKCAERALKNGEFQTTLKHLKRCLQRTPDWPEVYLLKSRTYEKVSMTFSNTYLWTYLFILPGKFEPIICLVIKLLSDACLILINLK